MYQLTESGVLRLEDQAWIPNDPGNRDWQAYQEWLKAGHTPKPRPEPVIDPKEELERVKQEALKNITVVVDEKTFKGDPHSQQELLMAIMSSLDNDETVSWPLANGTLTTVPILTLKKVLRAAKAKQHAIEYPPS